MSCRSTHRARTAALLLFSLQGCAGPLPPEAMPPIPSTAAPTLADARAGVVGIGRVASDASKPLVVDRWLGTGFAVDAICTFATAKHVVAGLDPARVAVRFPLPDRKRFRSVVARVLYLDPISDLAFLRIDKFNERPCQSGALHVFTLRDGSENAPLAGREVAIIGHPHLSDGDVPLPVMRSGIVATEEISLAKNRMLLLDLVGVKGFSGSPVVLRETGEVVAVVYGPGPIPREAGFEWATPITRSDYVNATTETSR